MSNHFVGSGKDKSGAVVVAGTGRYKVHLIETSPSIEAAELAIETDMLVLSSGIDLTGYGSGRGIDDCPR
jgi:hypothetical protein